MDFYDSIIDLKTKEEVKAINLYISKSNLMKLLKHSKKLKLTKSKFIDYFFQKINTKSLTGLDKEQVKIKKCIKIKRTIKVKTFNKIKNLMKKKDITLTTLINRLIEKHL